MILRTLAALTMCAVSLAAADNGIRPEVARLLPPDAVTIGGFEIQVLRSTPLFAKLASRFPIYGDENLDQIFAVTGFDPKKDIHRILASGEGAPGESARATLVILEGRFDLDGEAKGLLDLFRPVGDHAGVTLYKAVSERGNPYDATFAFLDKGTVVIGDRPRVEAAIDRWFTPGLSRPARVALTQKGAHVWAATLEPQKVLAAYVDRFPGGGGPLRAITESMEALSIRGTARAAALNAELAFLCGGPDDARSLADAAQALAALGALSDGQNRPELAELLSKLQVSQADNETTVSVELTEEQFLDLGRRGFGAAGVSLR